MCKTESSNFQKIWKMSKIRTCWEGYRVISQLQEKQNKKQIKKKTWLILKKPK